jgi:MraZ protein
MFRGTYTAKIDEKGRLKMPAAFRKLISDEYGDEIFITSFDGQKALFYPLKVWNELEAGIAKMSKVDPTKEKFLRIINYWGLQSTLDVQGRTGLPVNLKEKAELNGEIVVMGMQDHFEIWNHERFTAEMNKQPLTDQDMESLVEKGL